MRDNSRRQSRCEAGLLVCRSGVKGLRLFNRELTTILSLVLVMTHYLRAIIHPCLRSMLRIYIGELFAVIPLGPARFH